MQADENGVAVRVGQGRAIVVRRIRIVVARHHHTIALAFERHAQGTRSCSTTSFSVAAFSPCAPGSVPPCAGSSTIMGPAGNAAERGAAGGAVADAGGVCGRGRFLRGCGGRCSALLRSRECVLSEKACTCTTRRRREKQRRERDFRTAQRISEMSRCVAAHRPQQANRISKRPASRRRRSHGKKVRVRPLAASRTARRRSSSCGAAHVTGIVQLVIEHILPPPANHDRRNARGPATIRPPD